MLTDIDSDQAATISYRDVRDFEQQLSQLLPSIRERVQAHAEARRPFVAEIESGQIGRQIFKLRILQRMPLDDLARETNIRSFMLRRLERHDEAACLLTLIQIKRIAKVLGVYLLTEPLTLHGPAEFDDPSLDNLVSFVWSRKEWLEDELIFRMWGYYAPAAENSDNHMMLAAREDDAGKVFTIDDWERVFRRFSGYLPY